jgi:hypothetical protein
MELAVLAILAGPLTLLAVALVAVVALLTGGWFGLGLGAPLLAFGVLGAIGTSLWVGALGSVTSVVG